MAEKLAQSIVFPAVNPVNRVLRQLQKEESSLFNCVCSVSTDAAFIDEVARLHADVPVLANLRCGLWYVRDPQTTCYFKSTDGHNGNWSFSTTRLNIHVAEAAANHGGCVIVDATRRGKTFPVGLQSCSMHAASTSSTQRKERQDNSCNERLLAGLPDQDNPYLGCGPEQSCGAIT